MEGVIKIRQPRMDPTVAISSMCRGLMRRSCDAVHRAIDPVHGLKKFGINRFPNLFAL
jgi:hypothetical protein